MTADSQSTQVDSAQQALEVEPEARRIPIRPDTRGPRELPVLQRGVILPTLEQIKSISYRVSWVEGQER